MSSILIRRANMVCGGTPPVPIDYSTRYLTFEAKEAGTFSLTIPAEVTTSYVTSVSYSVDGGETWTTTNNSSSEVVITTPTIQAGRSVLWKGIADGYATSSAYSNFASTGNFVVNGNIMSFFYGDNFADKTALSSNSYSLASIFRRCTKLLSAKNLILNTSRVEPHGYEYMFSGCSLLVDAPELPATLVSNYGYASMFRNCTALTKAPSELPDSTPANYSYQRMFQGCTSLTKSPTLTITSTSQYCCYYMFSGCTALTTAPELLAASLTSYCYNNMFSSCSSLNYIKCLATTRSATGCLNSWVDGVAASGTFVKAAAATDWATGKNGIPSGWTVVDAS